MITRGKKPHGCKNMYVWYSLHSESKKPKRTLIAPRETVSSVDRDTVVVMCQRRTKEVFFGKNKVSENHSRRLRLVQVSINLW